MASRIALLGCGTGLLVAGNGGEVDSIHFRSLEAFGVPAGLCVLLVGVALAVSLPVHSAETITLQIFGPSGALKTMEQQHSQTMFRLRQIAAAVVFFSYIAILFWLLNVVFSPAR